ncbi:MAG TPA: aminotransferase [Candidatus Mediterraneibacter cottocaccae]|nr:aminotransferase [Candidatus Mediterraneibacter cottocaccae]
MKIKPFAVEEWMNKWEVGAKYNIAETCVDSVSLKQLLEICGEDEAIFTQTLLSKRLSYGDITGLPKFKEGVCKLYKTIQPDEIVPTHGAAGANHHVFMSLISQGDHIISIMPTYQQLYSIPESIGARVEILQLKKENGYLLDINELKRLVTSHTKMICVNNPNNPTGALMSREMLLEVVDVAKSVGAWVLCDEVYRHLTQTDAWCESIVDLYEKGISVSSMSKVFSLAGIRLGWIASHDKEAVAAMLSHRDYNLISCGMLDETIAALALANSDKLLARNRAIVRENLEIVDRWIKNEGHASYVKPKAGTTALIHYDLDIPSYDLCADMYKKTGAFVTPGDCFEEKRCFRLGYACDKATLEDGLAAISEYFEMVTKGE